MSLSFNNLSESAANAIMVDGSYVPALLICTVIILSFVCVVLFTMLYRGLNADQRLRGMLFTGAAILTSWMPPVALYFWYRALRYAFTVEPSSESNNN